MKSSRIFLCCLVLFLAGSAQCKSPEESSRPPWERQLGKKISVVGIAQNAKLGAVLVVDGQPPLYLKDKSDWNADLLNQTLRVTGTLKKFNLPVATQENGSWSAGAGQPGTAYRLENFRWERVESILLKH